MNNQWNSEVVTPVNEGAGTQVLDSQDQVQSTLSAGSNIVIAEGEISASGGASYSAGTGIAISEQNAISIDDTVVATQNDLTGKQDTLSAGNMISLTNNEAAVSTTAGITDIQQVSALPASPVATVLYLIPEA